MPVLRIADTHFNIFAAIMCTFTALSEATGCKKGCSNREDNAIFQLEYIPKKKRKLSNSDV